jgi:hypothetical protein
MANNWLSEQVGQTNTPNEDIQSLIMGVDISSFIERMGPILDNPVLKEKLLQILKENQPITGWLQLSRILKKIEETQVATEKTQVATEKTQVATEKTQVATEKTQSQKENKERYNSAMIAQKETSLASTNIYNILPKDSQNTITTEINTKLQDINSGKIPKETKSFLDSIGANTPESITSPEVQSILTAHISTQVYLANKDSIVRANPKLESQFNILDRNKFALWLSGSVKVPDLGNIIPDQTKSDREAIISTVNSLTKWSPDTMITRTGDRLSFHDPKDERYSYDIDMAKRPPQLSKSLGNLSISREIVALSKEEQEKLDKKNQAEKQLKSNQDILSQSKNEFWQGRRDEYILQGENKSDGIEPTNLYSQYIGENRWDHARYEILEQAYAQWDIAETGKASALEQMQDISEKMRENNAKNILNDTLSPSDRGKITSMLESRIYRLGTLKRSEESLARIDKKALDYTPVGWGSEQWEKNAAESLSFISELGLNNLGQQWFEEVMEAWNEKKKWSINHQINLSENPKIDDIQRKEFREAIDRFTWGSNNRNNKFNSLANNLTGAEFISSHWDTRKKRAEYLFGDKKTDIQDSVIIDRNKTKV